MSIPFARHRRIRAALVGAAILMATAPGLRCGEPPPPAPAPATEEPAPPRRGTGRPLDPDRVAVLLARAEHNLFLHGLTLHPRYLRNAVEDYTELHLGMPGEKALDGMGTEQWNDARFTAAFALAFALAREELPRDAAEARDVVERIHECLTVASTLNAEAAGLWIVEGMGRERAGDHEGAVERIDRGLERLREQAGLAPWQVTQLRLFGLLARARASLGGKGGREHRALEDIKEAGALVEQMMRSPDMPREGSRLRIYHLTHLAAAQQHLDQYQEAETTLDTLMKEDPGAALHPYNRGLVAAWQQKFEEALKYYRRAADLDRTDPAPHIKIAYILLSYHPGSAEPDVTGALKEAAIYLNLTGGVESDEYCACRGEAAQRAGNASEAERWFERALALNPNCRKALQRMVRILGAEGGGSPEIRIRLEEYTRRLSEILRKARTGEGMETARPEITFC